MNKSDSITNLSLALAEAQKHIGAAAKESDNPFFKSRYADLGSVMAVCKSPLLANGISVLQIVDNDGINMILETTLLHSSGEFISGRMKMDVPMKMVMPPKDKPEAFRPYLAPDPQAAGSAITYARRYALQAMLFIPSVDDDAEWAARAKSHKPKDEKTRDREAITKMIAQYEQDAKDAPSDERKRTLLGLASELRVTLADMDLEEGKALDAAGPQAETSPDAVKRPRQKKVTTPPAETPAATVEEPATASNPSQPEWMNHIITQLHVSAYKDRKIGDLTLEELQHVQKSWVEKHADKIKENPAKAHEAALITEALKSRQEPK